MDSVFVSPGEIAESKITLRFVITSFILGAIAGTIGDYVHVITHTDGYPVDGPFPFLPFSSALMPVWVPLLFGSAFTLMACSHKWPLQFFHPRLGSNRAFAIASLPLFVLIYALTGFIQAGTGGWQDVWLAVTALAIWWFADRTLTGAILALMNAFAGTLFEINLVRIHGFFYYPEHANFFGVPSWLPYLYIIVGTITGIYARQVK